MTEFKYKIAPISSFLQIQEELEKAFEFKYLMILYGTTGYGKSIPLLNFCNGKSEISYTEIRAAERPKAFFGRFNDIWEPSTTLEEVISQSSLDWLIQSSSYELIHTRNSQMLILDEAGNFPRMAQAYLRQVWDNIKSHSAMVLSGPDRYRVNMKKWNRDLTSPVPELVSRVSKFITIQKPDFNDIKLICKTNDIDDIKIIKAINKKFGNLRHVKEFILSYHRGDTSWIN